MSVAIWFPKLLKKGYHVKILDLYLFGRMSLMNLRVTRTSSR